MELDQTGEVSACLIFKSQEFLHSPKVNVTECLLLDIHLCEEFT